MRLFRKLVGRATAPIGRVAETRYPVERYIPEPRPASAGFDYPTLSHLDGVPWFEAPIPAPTHACWVQTRGGRMLDLVERCACGAITMNGERPWLERNSSDPAKWTPPPATPYNERKQGEINEREALYAMLRDRSSSGE